jgi:hypothetical protein
MSYSFNVKAATKAEAIAVVGEELDKVVQAQPIHERDRSAAAAAAEGIINALHDDPTRSLSVGVSGWISWSEGDVVTQANVSVTASLE